MKGRILRFDFWKQGRDLRKQKNLLMVLLGKNKKEDDVILREAFQQVKKQKNTPLIQHLEYLKGWLKNTVAYDPFSFLQQDDLIDRYAAEVLKCEADKLTLSQRRRLGKLLRAVCAEVIEDQLLQKQNLGVYCCGQIDSIDKRHWVVHPDGTRTKKTGWMHLKLQPRGEA